MKRERDDDEKRKKILRELHYTTRVTIVLMFILSTVMFDCFNAAAKLKHSTGYMWRRICWDSFGGVSASEHQLRSMKLSTCIHSKSNFSHICVGEVLRFVLIFYLVDKPRQASERERERRKQKYKNLFEKNLLEEIFLELRKNLLRFRKKWNSSARVIFPRKFTNDVGERERENDAIRACYQKASFLSKIFSHKNFNEKMWKVVRTFLTRPSSSSSLTQK